MPTFGTDYALKTFDMSASAPQNQKLSQGISYFEEILQLMPNDRSALEFLAVAYGQQGETIKHARMVCKLADVLIAEKDADCAENLLPTLQEIGTADAYQAYNRIKAFLRTQSPRKEAQNGPNSAVSPFASEMLPAIKSELELLQELQSNGIVSEETARIVEQSLYGTLSSEGDVLISALVFIKNENPAECEQALVHLVNACQMPIVPIKSFEVKQSLLQKFPGTVLGRGVFPMAELGDTLLVALLNPMDEQLRRQITDLAGKPCQFFLALPEEMEAVLS